jgi:hypothetical protein
VAFPATSALDLPFADGSVDIVISQGLVHHIAALSPSASECGGVDGEGEPRPLAWLFRTLARVLRPRGRLLCTFWGSREGSPALAIPAACAAGPGTGPDGGGSGGSGSGGSGDGGGGGGAEQSTPEGSAANSLFAADPAEIAALLQANALAGDVHTGELEVAFPDVGAYVDWAQGAVWDQARANHDGEDPLDDPDEAAAALEAFRARVADMAAARGSAEGGGLALGVEFRLLVATRE